MSLDEGISDLIKRIYCSGGDDGQWHEITIDVLKATGGRAGMTSIADVRNRHVASYRAFGPDNSRFAIGMEEYPARAREDPSLAWAAANPTANFCDSSRTLPTAEYLRSDYVRWNRDRFGSTHWYVAYTPTIDGLSFGFSMHFPAERGPADENAQKLFRMLFEHMECALRLRRRPFDPESERALALLDSSGRVLELSAGALQLLAGRGALKVASGRLVTWVQAEQSKLDQCLSRALGAAYGAKAAAATRIEHPAGYRPWLVTARPVMERLGPFAHVRSNLLVDIHEGLPRIGSLQIMRSLFGLTARELDVVRLLADGHSVESSAQCLGISLNTARAHLRSVFAKTETTSQAHLVRLCAGLGQI